ncbi:cytochrome c oxidase assembly factor Coa1 family protein, partial [Rhizobiaceae sp. 2RAB30]
FAIRSSEPYRMAMEQVGADQAVTAAIGNDVGSGFWTMGNINVQAGGTGEANLSIPIHGDKGAGTVIVRAVRNGGQWSIRLLVVKVDGQDAPIVLVNSDNLSMPDAAVGI